MPSTQRTLDLSDPDDRLFIVKRYRRAFSVKIGGPIPTLEEVRERIAAAFPEPSSFHPVNVSAEYMCVVVKSLFDKGHFHY
jgi:hypothetical protein